MKRSRHTIRKRHGARAQALAWLSSCALVLVAWSATANNISNTASVRYSIESSGNQIPATVSVNTNTVTFAVENSPTKAEIQFRREVAAAQASGGSASGLAMAAIVASAVVPAIEIIPVDGGTCRNPAGSFAPIPTVIGFDGAPIDKSGVATVLADSYSPGEPMIVTVEDADHDIDPTVRDFVTVTIESEGGKEREVLRMQETSASSGVFATVLQSAPRPPEPAQFNCQLSIAPNGTIVVKYDDNVSGNDDGSGNGSGDGGGSGGSGGDGGSPATVQISVKVVAAPAARQVLRLEQAVSVREASIGDFLQYQFRLKNPRGTAVTGVRLVDALPAGVRYKPGSLKIDGQPAPDAMALGGDAHSLGFTVGSVPPSGEVALSFVAEVSSGAPVGPAVNTAYAVASGGLASNTASAMVQVREPLFTSGFTIVGRVLDAGCKAGDAAKGVAGVRLLLDDGTFVVSDADGAYHFEGVRPGTHVVQMDVATLPATLEAASCVRNTRFAGRADSQFVEAEGGALWRADFHLQPKPSVQGEVGVQLQVAAGAKSLDYTVEVDGGGVPVSGLRAMVLLPDGSAPVPGSATVDGAPAPDPEVNGNVAIFVLGDPGSGWRKRLAFRASSPSACSTDGALSRAMAVFDAGGKRSERTPASEARLACGPPQPPAQGVRASKAVAAAAEGQAALPSVGGAEIRKPVLDDATAAGGGDIDWLANQAPGQDWLFPSGDYNPRAPAITVVVKHLPTQTVRLRVDGQPVKPLLFEGTSTSPDKTVAASTWRAVPIGDGDNLLQADILDGNGAVATQLSRTVHFSGVAARAELVASQSLLVSDGIRRPVIAVRMLDQSGHPVRDGASGDYQLSPPYLPAETVELQQRRQLAGRDSAKPTWHVSGDDGIAYIELQPTSVAGNATLSFDLDLGTRRKDTQALKVWLKSAPRDWIVVGFAAGSVGYDTLGDNMQALPQGEDGKGVRGDGQVSLYAKGRVLGKWLLTLAYDSDKPTSELRGRRLLSTIDPQQYYTLYGDGAQQGYDAASARKLYLKLERDQFYVLFGDFQTGLDHAELSRYQRTLTGAKVEYRGPLLEASAFAAKTSQNFARDEIPGDGTSGLYRLSRNDVVINSEQVRIETRDRYHSEQIVDSRELVRHIDYDIDYANGTLFFREPIASRNFDFNPNFIVVAYETVGTGDEYLNGGGRVAVHLLDDRLEAGVSYIRDEDAAGRSQLAGVDARYRVGEHDEVRAEAAVTRSDAGDATSSGDAWLLEWQHRGERLDLLAYARSQDLGFGLGQQNRVEGGTLKIGAQGGWRIDEHFSLQGEAYRLEDRASGAVRNALRADLAWKAGPWNARAGLQWAHDQSADGEVAESRQLRLGAGRSFGKLDLDVQADVSLGGKNESVDFPARLQVAASYRINEAFRLVAAQEFTDGDDRDTATTRVGFELTPWANARISSTFNQSRITEYGPRTFALFGLSQKFLVGGHWGFDVALDSSQAFNESGATPLVVDRSQPIAAGGIRDGGALTEDFLALSGGATYRSELWSWNARLEGRQSDSNDRYGFTSAFLRQARDGVALSASVQAFSQKNADGSSGLLANAQLAWAYRPLGSRWSLLDKFEFRLDEVGRGAGESILGQATLAVQGDARSRRLINNFVLNYVSDAWDSGEGDGNVLDLNQRSQFSLYYGSKYVLDSFGADDYAGYSDIIGSEWRFDLSPRIDIGLRASVLHSWSRGTFAWSFGPSIGFSPFTNTWVSVGYNLRGFEDRDFGPSHYTAEGAYLMLRLKFDQASPLLRSVLSGAAQ